MKMKQIYVRFEKQIELTLFAPESASAEDIERLTEKVARDGLRGWDDPEWESYVGKAEIITLPDEDLKLGPANKYGYRECMSPRLAQGLVVDDEREDIVDPVDATWWISGEKTA